MLGQRGPAVRDWQAYLVRAGYLAPGQVDSVHGPRTEAASVQLERAQGKPSAPVAINGQLPGADSRLVTEVIADPGYRYGTRQRGDVRWLVLHSAECSCSDKAARNVARYLAGQPNASAHYVVGPTAVVQCVRERHAAYTQGPANALSISIEHAGRSLPGAKGEPATDWIAEPEMLLTSARLARDICDRWGLPWRLVDAAGVALREPGVAWHGAVTRAYGVKGGHVDPLRWPWAEWMALGR